MTGQRVRLYIEGFNQMRLISALIKEDIKFGEIDKKTSGKMYVSVAKKDSKKAFAILEKMCYNYKVIFTLDVTSVALATAARSGLIVGLIIFFTALMLLYGFIWRVEIQGLEKVNELTVHKVLKSNGFSVGSKRKNIDKNQLERILNSVDGILESGVEIVGTTLKIYVVEDTDFLESRTENYADIVSNYDAVVTRVVARMGTPTVKNGSYVKKGAPLILASKTDTLGNALPSPANGEVYGRVSFMKASEFALSVNKVTYTGKTYKSTSISLFGLRLGGKTTHGYERFQTKKTSGYLFEGLLLPIKYEQTRYIEIKEETLEYTKEELAQEFLDKAVDELVIKAGGAEIDKKYTLKPLDNDRFLVVAYVTAELKIS